MKAYKNLFPVECRSKFIGEQFGKHVVREVRADDANSGGSGRIAIVDTNDDESEKTTIIRYSRLTSAMELRRTDPRAANRYINTAVELGVGIAATRQQINAFLAPDPAQRIPHGPRKRRKPTAKVDPAQTALRFGDPGIGKSTAVKAAAEAAGLEVIDIPIQLDFNRVGGDQVKQMMDFYLLLRSNPAMRAVWDQTFAPALFD